MKKLLLSFVLAAFAFAAQAGTDGEKSGSCCGAAQVSTQTKAQCPMAKQAKATKNVRQASAKQSLKSPKATG